MIHYFVKYRPDTDEIRAVGHTSTRGEIALQADPDNGIAVVEADGQTIMNGAAGADTYREAVRVHLCRQIDEAAAMLLTDPFEAIHAAQAAEARGQTEATPYLDAIAAETGRTIEDVKAAVLGQADAADARRAAVNAKRQAAKAAVRDAVTIAAMVEASKAPLAD